MRHRCLHCKAPLTWLLLCPECWRLAVIAVLVARGAEIAVGGFVALFTWLRS